MSEPRSRSSIGSEVFQVSRVSLTASANAVSIGRNIKREFSK